MAPVVSGVVPSDGDVVAPGVVDVSGLVSDSGSGVDRVRVLVRRTGVSPALYWRDGVGWVESWSWNRADLDGAGGFVLEDVSVVDGGSYELFVWAWDGAGNLADWTETIGLSRFAATG